MKDTYCGYKADPNLEIETVTYVMNQPIETHKYTFKIGKPVFLFPTVKNPDRKWWQVWKPARIIDPKIFEPVDTPSKER